MDFVWICYGWHSAETLGVGYAVVQEKNFATKGFTKVAQSLLFPKVAARRRWIDTNIKVQVAPFYTLFTVCIAACIT